MADHPSQSELSGFLLGTLPPESTEAVADHIEHCHPCQETVNALDKHKDTLLSFLRTPPPPPVDPAWTKALEKAAAIANNSANPPSQLSVGTGAQPSVAGAAVGPVPTRDAFVAALKASRVIDDADWAAMTRQPAVAKAADGKALARVLVEAGTLTKFQATLIYQNKPKALQFGEYLVLDKIGAGGMGQVYKARHRRMKRVVAIKVLPKSAVNSADAVKRFQREVEAAARLVHPNIVIAHDAGQQDNIHFLVMEYVDGKDLAALVKADGPLPVDKAIDYTLQAARGLAFAHAEGVVHRDIKPANLLLDKRGVVKILDMGLARLDAGDAAAKDGLTQSGQVMGTVDYMAPEQAMDTRVANAKADIYSLGCTLYRVLVGDNVYGGETLIQKLLAHRENPIPSLTEKRPDVPAALDAVFQKMVAKSPDDRYESMHALVEALEQVRRDMAAPAPAKQPAKTPAPKKPQANMERAKPAAKGVGFKPPQKWIIAAAAGFTFVMLGVWIYIYNKNGELKAVHELADGDRLEVRQSPKDEAPGPAAGANHALLFDATTRGIMILPRLKYDASHPLTIEAWVKPIDDGRDVNPTYKGRSHVVMNPLLELNFNFRDRTWQLRTNTEKPGFVDSATVPHTDSSGLTHVAAILVDGTLKLFLNGKQKLSQPLDAPVKHAVPSNDAFHIGDGPEAGAARFYGVIDEVQISRVARYDRDFVPVPRFKPDADTLALYHFDEGAGDRVADASTLARHVTLKDETGGTKPKWTQIEGAGRDGKIVDAKRVRADDSVLLTTGGSPIPQPVTADYALEFDGTTSSTVSLPNFPYVGLNDFTVEYWITPYSIDQMRNLITLGSSCQMRLDRHGKPSWQLSVGRLEDVNGTKTWVQWFAQSTQSPELRKRVHVAGVRQGGRLRLFLNGAPGNAMSPAKVADFPLTESGPSHLGRGERSFPSWHGLIDELRISKSALYDKEFTPDRRFESDADTVALYHFDEGTGDTLHDATGHGHHGKITGAKWVRADGSPITPAAGSPTTFTHDLLLLGEGTLGRLIGKPYWREKFAGRKVLNRANDGVDIPRTAQTDVLIGSLDYYPRLVVLQVGTHDLTKLDAAAAGKAYRDLVNQIRGKFPSAVVILTSLRAAAKPQYETPVKEFNATLHSLADDTHVYFVDFSDVTKTKPEEEFLDLFAERLKPVVDRLLAAPTTPAVNYAVDVSAGAAAWPTDLFPGNSPLTVELYATPRSVAPINRGLLSITGALVAKTSTSFWQISSDHAPPAVKYDLAQSPTVKVGERTHLAGVRTATELRLFVNGKLEATTPLTGPVAPDPCKVTVLGYIPASSQFRKTGWEPFDGTIDEVRFSTTARYERDFTPAPRLETDEHTWALYHCDEGSGELLVDASGHERHAKTSGEFKWVRAEGSPPSGAPNEVREALTYILARKGRVEATIGGIKKTFLPNEVLPVGAIEDVGIHWNGNRALTNADFAQFRKIPSIKKLFINSSNFDDSCLEYLDGQTLITNLWIDQTNLSDAGHKRFIQQSPALKWLNIGGPNCTDKTLAELHGFTQLASITFMSPSKVTPAGLDALKRALPNCTINPHVPSGANAAPVEAWQSLFNGTTLAGWRGIDKTELPAGWKVESDGSIVTDGSKNSIATVDQFGDFELELEWKVAPGANGGVFYLYHDVSMPSATDGLLLSAPEYQVVDNVGHPNGKRPETSAGSVYGLYPPSKNVALAVGQWNKTRIVVRGSEVEHWLGDQQVLKYTLGSDDWKQRVAAHGRFRNEPEYGRLGPGRIALQGNTGTVWYRNIRARTTGSAPSGGVSAGPTLTELTALNTRGQDDAYPWVLQEGRVIYFTRETDGRNSAIYRAERPNLQSPFSAPQKIFDGRHMAVTADERCAVLFPKNYAAGIQMAEVRRRTKDDAWGVPQAISVIPAQENAKSPCLSSDGSMLVYQRQRTATNYPGKMTEFAVCRRATLDAAWSTPELLPLESDPRLVDSLTWPCLSDDGLRLSFNDGGDRFGNLCLAERTATHQPFGNYRYVQVDGTNIKGRSPRWLPSRGEVYFSRDPHMNVKDSDLCLITGLSHPGGVAAAGPEATNHVLKLDGVAACVDVPSLSYDGVGPLTVEAYIGIDSLPFGARFPIAIRNNETTYVKLQADLFEPTGGTSWLAYAGRREGGFHARQGVGPTRKMQHLALVFDADGTRLFIDGQSISTPDPGSYSAPKTMIKGLFLGYLGDSTNYFAGRLDEVRISSIARYKTDFTPPPRHEPDANTLALYHCDEGSGNVLVDASSHGHHGQVRGGKWVRAEEDAALTAAADANLPKPVVGDLSKDVVAELKCPFEITHLVLSPDGQYLMCRYENRLRQFSLADNRIVWDIRLPSPLPIVYSLAVSPDGKHLAAGGWRRDAQPGAVHVFSTSDGALEQTWPSDVEVRRVAYSPDGSLLAAGLVDGKVRLLSATNGNMVHELSGHTTDINGLAFAPDGKRLASGSGTTPSNGGPASDRRTRLKLWNVADGQEVPLASPPENQSYYSLKFSPDGRMLVIGSTLNWVEVRSADGAIIGKVGNPKQHALQRITTAPSNRHALYGSSTLLVVEIPDGKVIHEFAYLGGWIDGVEVTPDGRFAVVTVDKKSSAYVLRLPPECADLTPQKSVSQTLADPEFQQWLKDTAALSAQQQLDAVSKKLVELNPGFDGNIVGNFSSKPKVVAGVVTELGFSTLQVKDISPVRAFPGLQKLSCRGMFTQTSTSPGMLSDLTPLAGLKLTSLDIGANRVRDLSPLRGMPLTNLNFGSNRVVDLSPLEGMPLTQLGMNNNWRINDLGPLRGMKLVKLSANDHQAKDISPLAGMQLISLTMATSPVTDFTLLHDMPLEFLDLTGTALKDAAWLHNVKTLKTLMVARTSLTAEQIAALKAALPNCKVETN